jgi:hypothetical protein
MFNGRVELAKTNGVNQILSDQNFQFLRDLTLEDSDTYLWLPTEQIVALPHITTVQDKDGRTFVQNETFLIPIHDYIQLTNPTKIFSPHFHSNQQSIPEKLEPLEIDISNPKDTGH